MSKSGTAQAHAGEKGSGFRQVRKTVGQVDQVIDIVLQVLFHLRKLVLAAPVVYYAIKLAAYNSDHLPAVVGINLQSSGAFADVISRQMAVMGPLALTGGCLVMLFCSRKVIYPWVISVFSLALPILLLVSNIYPN